MTRLLRVARYLHLGTSAALVLSAVVQAATFVLLARGLGAPSFGLLILLQAAAQVGLALIALGTGEALIRRVSRDPRLHGKAFGHALIVTLAAWALVGAILSGAVTIFFGGSKLATLPVCIFLFGELIGNRLSGLSEQIAVAHGRISAANRAQLVPSLARMGVVFAGLRLIDGPAIGDWLVLLGATRALIGLAMALGSAFRYGRPVIHFDKESFRFGLLSLAVGFSSTIQFNADRLILGALAAPQVVAVYASAARAIQLANLPGIGLLRNLYPGFFRAGARGIGDARSFARQNFARVAALGLCCGALLMLGAGALPFVLGKAFAGSVTLLRALAFIPLLESVHWLLADALTGSDNQAFRTAIGISSTFLYLALIAVFTAIFGVWGLVGATYLFEIFAIASCFLAIEFLARRAQGGRSSGTTRAEATTVAP